MKKIVGFLVISLFMLGSGAFLPLLKDGGAREQGFEQASTYNGVLNAVPLLWIGTVIALLAASLLSTRWWRVKPQWHLICLVSLGLLSSLWSDYPRVSVRVGILMLASYLLVSVQVSMYGARAAHESLKTSLNLVLLASLLTILLVPSYGISVGLEHEGRWQGVFNHKNSLGVFSAFAFMYFAWRWQGERRVADGLSCLLSALLAWGSQSGSSWAAIAVVVAILAASGQRASARLFAYAVLATLLILSCSAIWVSLYVPEFELLDKSSTFTGRSAIWVFMFAKTADSPWIGQGLEQFGAYVAAGAGDMFSRVGFVVASAHNGFIDAVFSLGFLGAGLTLLAIYCSVRGRTGRSLALVLAFLSSMIIVNTFESQLVGFNLFFIGWCFVCIATAPVTASRLPRREDLPQAISPRKLRARGGSRIGVSLGR